MKAGVTMRLPQSIQIDYDVTFDEDCEIEPHCCIQGKSHIGTNCKIGAGSFIRDSNIPAKTKISPHSILTNT